MDLGGGSTQIVVPNNDLIYNKDGSFSACNIMPKNLEAYSFTSYGGDEMRYSHYSYLLYKDLDSSPCLLEDYSVEIPWNEKLYVIKGTGNGKKCREIIIDLIQRLRKGCDDLSCMPESLDFESIISNFKFVGVSLYFFIFQFLTHFDLQIYPDDYITINDYEKATDKLCSNEFS
eukprot:UN24023